MSKYHYLVSDAHGREFIFMGAKPVVGTDGWMLPVSAPSGAEKRFRRQLPRPRSDWMTAMRVKKIQN